MKPSQTTCFIILGIVSLSAALQTKHYVEWFPSYGYIFDEVARDECVLEHTDYLTGMKDGVPFTGRPTTLANRVVSCVLKRVTENVKANTAAAAVLLGLLPTVLGLAGSSTAEMGILAHHRPLLAFILALGSPVVSPTRAFEFQNPKKLLEADEDELMPLPKLRGRWAVVVSALQYVVAAAAAGNIIHIGLELGIKAVCSFAPDTVYLPLLWSLTAVLLNALGALFIYLRLKFVRAVPDAAHEAGRWDWIKREGGLSMLQPTMAMRQKTKTYFSVLVSWSTSTFTILHLIFGTLVLSCTLFVAVPDALAIAGRFFGSMVVCRAIVVFEFSGLKGKFPVKS